MWRGGQISDPVHGYVRFTGLEKHVLAHPVTQRLRHISQNGLSHLVYPELRTSRFSHSLGTMHLASQFLASSISGGSGTFRETVCEAVQEAAGRTWSPGKAVRQLQRDDYATATHATGDIELLMLAEQALRLAALFHDLGHLPFSHDFETAIEHGVSFYRSEADELGITDTVRTRVGLPKLHERLGHELAGVLLDHGLADLDGDQYEFARVSFNLAIAILEAMDKPSTPVLQWLHSLIDGEVDADRCDYLLRDGRNYGFPFARYDLHRLLENLTVFESDGGYSLGIREPGVSSIESFLTARYRSYQYGVRHHKVAQVGAALRQSIWTVLLGESNRRDVKQFLLDLAQLAGKDGVAALNEPEKADLLSRFSQYDDIWFTHIMRQQAATNENPWLHLALYRRPGPRSLWKRLSEFPIQPVREFNEQLPPSYDNVGLGRWADAARRLESEDGVLVVLHSFKPWQTDPNDETVSQFRVSVRGKGKEAPLSTLSPLVRSLSQVWMDDVQVHAFVDGDSRLPAAKTSDEARSKLASDVIGDLLTSVKDDS